VNVTLIPKRNGKFPLGFVVFSSLKLLGGRAFGRPFLLFSRKQCLFYVNRAVAHFGL
jgi:hypothetical protein